MTVKLEFITEELETIEATIDGGKWTCGDPFYKKRLDLLVDPIGPWTSDPDPDYTAAIMAARIFGGKIIRHVKPEFVTDRIY